MSDKLSLRRAVEHGFIEADHQHAHLENPHLVSNDEISSMLGALRTELATADSFVFPSLSSPRMRSG